MPDLMGDHPTLADQLLVDCIDDLVFHVEDSTNVGRNLGKAYVSGAIEILIIKAKM
jgi:hypothetical protein